MLPQLLRKLSADAAELLEIPLRGEQRPLIDLSIYNPEGGVKLADRDELWRFIGKQYLTNRSPILWGGYLEKRATYAGSDHFGRQEEVRDLHLGIDFWAAAGTEVYAPVAGTIHSFQDNEGHSNYGPTIILRHEAEGMTFHTLYGHLSRKSLEGLEAGKILKKGERVGWLGEGGENGEWPPHLHFQIVFDMEEWSGDYPGVCREEDMDFYAANWVHVKTSHLQKQVSCRPRRRHLWLRKHIRFSQK
jgi:murein DD-endopeptidase MepM/ murein hydrolase activator NlpD